MSKTFSRVEDRITQTPNNSRCVTNDIVSANRDAFGWTVALPLKCNNK